MQFVIELDIETWELWKQVGLQGVGQAWGRLQFVLSGQL